MFSYICQLIEGLSPSAVVNHLYGDRKLHCIALRNPNPLLGKE